MFNINKSVRMKIILVFLWIISIGLTIAHFLGDGSFPIVVLIITTVDTVIIRKKIQDHQYDTNE